MSDLKKISRLIKKEFLVLSRNKIRLFSLIFLPIILITFFGYGMGGEVTDIPTVFVEPNNGNLSQETIDIFNDTDTFDVIDVVTSESEAKELIDNGTYKAAIILPESYNSLNITDRNVELYVDSSDQVSASVAIPTSEIIFNEISKELGVNQVTLMSSKVVQDPSFLAQISSAFNDFKLSITNSFDDIDYIDYFMPGAIAISIMFVCMFSMGDSIAGERERGELSRIFITPTDVKTVVLGKITSNLIIEVIQALILLISAILIFDIVINGEMWLIILLIILISLCFVSMGMIVSARTKSQQNYIQTVLLLTLPFMFISGIFYPVDTMPWIFQKIAAFTPLTYACDALRCVMLKGSTTGDILLDILALCVFTIIFFVGAIKVFNRDM